MATEEQINKVVARVKGFTLGKNLTSELVGQFIDEETNIVIGFVSNIYQTPITKEKSPISFSIIETCITHRVLRRIELFLKTSTGVDKSSQAITDYMKRSDEAKMLTEGITKGTINLPDAPRIGAGTFSNFGTKKYRLDRDEW